MNIATPQGFVGALQTWASFITRIANALVASGTTAERPTSFLWTGRRYYDETLAIPIYYNVASVTDWKDSTGADA